MTPDATRPQTVRQAITARIAALSPSDGYSSGAVGYAQASTDAWRESEDPLFPEWEPSLRAHLSFFVDDRDLVDTLQTAGTLDDEPVTVAPVVVRFNFRIRGGRKTEDWDAAAEAGRCLLGHLLADGWGPAFVVSRDPRPLTRIPVRGDEFALVEVRVRVLYTLSLAAAA
jgi:hypothetical protein